MFPGNYTWNPLPYCIVEDYKGILKQNGRGKIPDSGQFLPPESIQAPQKTLLLWKKALLILESGLMLEVSKLWFGKSKLKSLALSKSFSIFGQSPNHRKAFFAYTNLFLSTFAIRIYFSLQFIERQNFNSYLWVSVFSAFTIFR